MRIILDLEKSVEQNAAVYFEKSKKYKKKLEGAKEALKHTTKKLKKAEEKIKQETKKNIPKKSIKKRKKKEWYENFRWFFSSTGFLVIAGRDATTNEIIIKKHTGKEDLVFHTNLSGSPFGVVKSENKNINEETKYEAAQFIACYSRAWKTGMSSLEVFYVNPDQVTKEAPSGEYIQKGSFMIYGKKNSLYPLIKLFVGIRKDNRIMSGPKRAVEKHCEDFVEVLQGREKTSKTAKKIKKRIGGELDEIIRVLPSGGCRLR
ncbi:DUF814 domain-containing protein [Candidatus Woesearchaeota archaeon]|nr:DUF814 domain-containing protein [Candidatus Woesearchaeota archaeon]